MEKILEKVCFNFRKFLSIIIAFISIQTTAQNTGQPPRQVTFTINGQVGTNQTVVFDSTANAWAILSEGNKHILKVPGIRLVTASGTTNYVSKFSVSNRLVNSQISDNGTVVNIANRLSVGLNSSVPGDASVYPFIIRASSPAGVMAGMQNTDSTGWTAFRLFNSNNERIGSFGIGNPGTALPFKNNMYLTTQTSYSNLILATQNTERLRITPSGDVGIGTTPGYKFHVAGTGYFSGDFTLGSNAIIATAPTIGIHATNKTYVDAGLSSKLDTSGVRGTSGYIPKFTNTRQLRNSLIYDNGTNVGIGTTSPASKMDVNGTFNVTGASTFANNATIMGNSAIGIAPAVGTSLRIYKNMTGSANSYGILNAGTIQADVTNAYYFNSIATVATGANVSTLFHFVANQSPFSGAVSAQYGFVAASGLTGATNNFGFLGGLPSGVGRWNLFMNGSADNVLMGNTAIGSLAASATHKLEVTGTTHITGNTTFDANVIIATAPSSGTHAANKTYVDTKQPGDADLTAIAALSGTGVAKRTGTDTWSVGPLAIADVTSLQTTLDAKQPGDGDLTAISALSGTGVAKRTGTDTWSVGPLAIADVTSLQTSLNAKLDSAAIRGTSGNVPVFTATRQIRNGIITDDGTSVGIGGGGSAKLNVGGSIFATGDVIAGRISGYGAVPGVSAGAGAGTLPNIALTGNNIAMHVEIEAGSTPTAGGDLFTVSYSYALTPKITLSPTRDMVFYNADISANTRDDSVYISAKSTTQFTVKLKTNRSLINSNLYAFDIHVIQ